MKKEKQVKIISTEEDRKIFFGHVLSETEPNQKLCDAVKKYKKMKK
jgi:hypothetical protein